jgi:hypothetical protein
MVVRMAREYAKPPWKRPAPADASHHPLTAADKAKARARAARAGRNYPNLVDNMAVAAEKGRAAKRRAHK